MVSHPSRGRFRRRHVLLTLLVFYSLTLLAPLPQASAEGSGSLFGQAASGFRANIEWRTSTYGGLIPRRTLLRVFARKGEYIMLASSAVDAGGRLNRGDILVYDPAQVPGPVTREEIPGDPAFSCLNQRAVFGNAGRGRIATRAQELAGPLPQPGGYAPCYYQAPRDGIYIVIFYGPTGPDSDDQTPPTGRLEALAEDFGPRQNTSITAWYVGVRASLNDTEELSGRVFSYYLAMFSGGNGRPVNFTVYVPTPDGFLYEVDYNSDPNGFMVYSNRYGFLDTDGNPLYHNVMAVATMPFQQQNQLEQLQGGVSLALPEHPLFLSPPDPLTLDALGIPRTPQPPMISDLRFDGTVAPNVTLFDEGGTFSFISSGPGVYRIVISYDGQNFDPDLPQNRELTGILQQGGPLTVAWDGRDNQNQPFPVGQGYLARVATQGGEVHFPFLDVENNLAGGPKITLLNPPGNACPPWNGGCSGAFYDDLGYRTASGVVVGTAPDGPLCPGNTGNPPAIGASDPVRGFDTLSDQRAYGFRSGGNPEAVCRNDSGFGDKKGLDLWTFYPSNIEIVPIRIIEPAAIDLREFRAQASPQGVQVIWATAAETNSYGFQLLRSASSNRAEAVALLETPFPARGQNGGARYEWLDGTAEPASVYRYWLQEIELGGTINEYGPVTVGGGISNERQVSYLPLVARE